MRKYAAFLMLGLSANAMADMVSLRNNTESPVYLAYRTSSGFASDSTIGWIRTGESGNTNSDSAFLMNMGVEKGDPYTLGYFDGLTQEYGICGTMISGTTRHFEVSDGQCVEVLDLDKVSMTNTTEQPTYIAYRGGDIYPGSFVINNDAGWLASGESYGTTSDNHWLHDVMGIEEGEVYSVAFHTAMNRVVECADDVVSGTARFFELVGDQCMEKASYR